MAKTYFFKEKIWKAGGMIKRFEKKLEKMENGMKKNKKTKNSDIKIEVKILTKWKYEREKQFIITCYTTLLVAV